MVIFYWQTNYVRIININFAKTNTQSPFPDIDECAHPGACGINTKCVNTPGNHTCLCLPGFVGNPHDGCADENECLRSPCGRDATCVNLEGSHRCDCQQGFSQDARTGDCLDLNECETLPCGKNADCRNKEGGYECTCKEGHHGNPKEGCEDINECLENPCGPNTVCQNTVGGFVCSCKESFTGNPYKECTDIDECLSNPCPTHARCENASPGYNCRCSQGYAADPEPKIGCKQVDVNILCSSNFDCMVNAECIESQCFCQDGFEPQGTVCVDIDECRGNEGLCGTHSTCINTPGSHRCECQA